MNVSRLYMEFIISLSAWANFRSSVYFKTRNVFLCIFIEFKNTYQQSLVGFANKEVLDAFSTFFHSVPSYSFPVM